MRLILMGCDPLCLNIWQYERWLGQNIVRSKIGFCHIGGETAQVYSEQVISRGQSHVTGAPLSNVVMFVMLITDIRVSSLWLSIMAGCCKLQVTCNGYAPLCTVIRPLFSSLSECPGLVSSVRVSDSLISQTVTDTQDSFGQSYG